MGVEERHGNGKLYYYRKRRDGDRVVSEYAGGGAVAFLEERKADQREQEREAERLRLRAVKLSEEQTEMAVDGFCDLADVLLTAALLASGYRKHKGEWRKRRDVGEAR
jgi:hypothetical protein